MDDNTIVTTPVDIKLKIGPGTVPSVGGNASVSQILKAFEKVAEQRLFDPKLDPEENEQRPYSNK